MAHIAEVGEVITVIEHRNTSEQFCKL